MSYHQFQILENGTEELQIDVIIDLSERINLFIEQNTYFFSNSPNDLILIRVAYNNLYRKILHVSRRSSASAMFVQHNIPNFECLIRRDIYSFTSRLKASNNLLINANENCWLLKFIIWKPVLVDRLFS